MSGSSSSSADAASSSSSSSTCSPKGERPASTLASAEAIPAHALTAIDKADQLTYESVTNFARAVKGAAQVCVMCGAGSGASGSASGRSSSTRGGEAGVEETDDAAESSRETPQTTTTPPPKSAQNHNHASSDSKNNSSRTPSCVIPRQNKDVCRDCDKAVWLHSATRAYFKWCKGCKNFLQIGNFSQKLDAAKCDKCRERGRTSYLLKKRASSSGGAGATCLTTAVGRARADSVATTATVGSSGDDDDDDDDAKDAAEDHLENNKNNKDLRSLDDGAPAGAARSSANVRPGAPRETDFANGVSSKHREAFTKGDGDAPTTTSARTSARRGGQGGASHDRSGGPARPPRGVAARDSSSSKTRRRGAKVVAEATPRAQAEDELDACWDDEDDVALLNTDGASKKKPTSFRDCRGVASAASTDGAAAASLVALAKTSDRDLAFVAQGGASAPSVASSFHADGSLRVSQTFGRSLAEIRATTASSSSRYEASSGTEETGTLRVPGEKTTDKREKTPHDECGHAKAMETDEEDYLLVACAAMETDREDAPPASRDSRGSAKPARDSGVDAASIRGAPGLLFELAAIHSTILQLEQRADQVGPLRADVARLQRDLDAALKREEACRREIERLKRDAAAARLATDDEDDEGATGEAKRPRIISMDETARLISSETTEATTAAAMNSAAAATREEAAPGATPTTTTSAP